MVHCPFDAHFPRCVTQLPLLQKSPQVQEFSEKRIQLKLSGTQIKYTNKVTNVHDDDSTKTANCSMDILPSRARGLYKRRRVGLMEKIVNVKLRCPAVTTAPVTGERLKTRSKTIRMVSCP